MKTRTELTQSFLDYKNEPSERNANDIFGRLRNGFKWSVESIVPYSQTAEKEDIVSNAIMKVLQNIDKILSLPERSMGSYAYMIARNEAKQVIRKRGAFLRNKERLIEHFEFYGHLDNNENENDEANFLWENLEVFVYEWADSVRSKDAHKYAEVFILKQKEKIKAKGVCDEMGLNYSNYKNNSVRIRQHLKEKMLLLQE